MRFKYLLPAIFLIFCSFAQAQSSASGKVTLTCSDAVSAALKNNPEIKKASAEISAAKGRYLNGLSLPKPELSVSYEQVPSGRGLNNFGERTIELSQSFDFPTSIYMRAKIKSKEIDMAEYSLKQAERRIAVNAKRAYMNSVYKTEVLKLLNENNTLSVDFMNKAEARYNSGEAGRLEYLTARFQCSRSKGVLETAEQELRSALAELKCVMSPGGLSSDNTDYVLADTISYDKINFSFEDIVRETTDKSPALIMASMQTETAAMENSVAWSGLLPSFNIAYSWQNIEKNSGYYGVSLGISLPLWFMFEQKGNIQESRGKMMNAEYELADIRGQVMLQLKNAWSLYQNEFHQVELYRNELLPQSVEMFNSAKANYESGEISYMEFIASKQTLAEARFSYLDALYRYSSSLLTLEEISGRQILFTDNNEGSLR